MCSENIKHDYIDWLNVIFFVLYPGFFLLLVFTYRYSIWVLREYCVKCVGGMFVEISPSSFLLITYQYYLLTMSGSSTILASTYYFELVVLLVLVVVMMLQYFITKYSRFTSTINYQVRVCKVRITADNYWILACLNKPSWTESIHQG